MSEILFEAGAWRGVEMAPEEAHELQRFYEANPEYNQAVCGEPPPPDAAHETFASRPPADWPFGRKWVLGLRTDDDALDGMADLLSNLFIDGVWHLGLFIVATRLHGRGAADVMYEGLESWTLERGAEWMRLGVVVGNAPAERFWARHGYVEVRRRSGLHMGQRVNDIRVMVKPLTDLPLDEYLARVARDRLESP